MDEVVIVAIPAEDDPVWKVSSEKVPHLTLLYMKGPFGNEENTIRYIQHVVDTSLCRFGLSVDRRGTLGADDADVLFFDKSYGGKELLAFRAFLLANEDILEAYQKADQYPIWTPHLTLGYPATPAKPNPNDYGLSWINFDRVAVWTDDYEGPEFVLKRDNRMEVDIDASWSIDEFRDHLAHHLTVLGDTMVSNQQDQESLDDVLMHFGVRGMKWGVRNDRKNSGNSRRATAEAARIKREKQAVRKDKRFARGLKRQNRRLAPNLIIMMNAADKYNSVDIPRINNKPEYKGKDLKKNPVLRQQYLREQQNAWIKRLDDSAFDFGGSNPSGTRRYGVNEIKNGEWHLVLKDVEHADEALATIKVNYDDLGHIIDIEIVEDSLTQSDFLPDDSNLDDVLIHFGIRGMKWGVRRPVGPNGLVNSSTRGSSTGIAKKTERRQAGVQQAIKKAKTKTPAARRKALDEKLSKLTTQEIQVLNNRIRATQEYRKLSAQEKLYNRSTPKRMADWLLGINQPQRKGGSSLKDKVEVDKVTNQIINDMLKAKEKKGG